MSTTTTDITAILDRIALVKPDFDSQRVEHAFNFAEVLYGEERHRTGLSVLEHTKMVLDILLPFEPDEETIIACILHHSVFEGGITLTELEANFGPVVRSIVSGVHLLSNINVEKSRTSIDDLRLILLSVSDDVRTILITLCDKCQHLDDHYGMSPEDARAIASDVLRLYAPVAARLGIYRLKHELERRAFPICYPSDAQNVYEQTVRLRKEHGDFLWSTAEELRNNLSINGVKVEIEHREKQPYSIFKKLQARSLSSVRDIYDLFAIRLIVDSAEECYQVLGLMHKIGRPVANRFKDYIAFPKPNGYQSLHTTIARLPGAPSDINIEVQIRTHQMNREAKYGVAAHWSYKEYGASRHALENMQLKKMLSMQESVGDEEQESSLADHIYVLTPRGDVVELPEGATPLDFAFQVHTGLGLSFKSAKINGSIVPLDHELENGDVVEILKFNNPKPSPQWMQMLKMSSSRSKLKRHLYNQRRSEFLAKGRELINTELAKHRLPLLDSDLSILRLYDGEVLPFSRREDYLVKVGQGSQNAASLFPHLDSLSDHEFVREEKPRQTLPKRAQHKERSIELEGGLPMPIRFSKSCKPEEGERGDIMGIVNRSGEVVIHREGCGVIQKANPERIIGARWKG
ncbi:HD domain-containing protein [Patescibacteria group bacterium]|nr:HD domain-containing protein [Patescibacteria group bacterium]MBU1123176.1 HD domain-containing protein [Patescibacteria group bacterium]MBU1910844.1 HD domain-containing protein [Patescibacteria group bacterium]